MIFTMIFRQDSLLADELDLKRAIGAAFHMAHSRQACARLLGLNTRSVDRYTRAALSCLAGLTLPCGLEKENTECNTSC
jgi:hypothetical protein